MENSPYSKENVRKGILHYLLGRGLAGIAGFATVILLVRFMDVQSYAGFTALTGLIALSGILAGLGLDRAISRYVPEARLERSAKQLGHFIWRITAIKLLAALVVSGVFYWFWQPILKLFSDVHLTHFPLALACFVIAETLFQHFSAVFQALLKQKALTRILIVQWAGRLIMIVWAVFADKAISLQESLLIMALPEMLGVLVFVLVLTHYLSQLNAAQQADMTIKNKDENWPDWNAIVRMASHNYGFTLLAAPPQGYFMKMLAAIFLPTQMVAAYGFFISIAERVRQYIPLHLLYSLIEPVMIGNYLQNRSFSTLNQRCQLLYKSNLLLLIPLLAWILAAGGYIVTSLTGGKFQEYSWLLALVMLQLTVGSHVVLLQLILNSVGASQLLVKAGFYALIGMALYLLIALNIHLTLLVAAPLAFSLVCNAYIIQALNRDGYPYSLSTNLFIGTTAAGAMACLLVYFAMQQPLMTSPNVYLLTLVSGALIALVYLACLYFFKAIRADEVHLVKSILIKS
jgi:O-antigen/teichoic acid export membrane protein